MDSPASRTRARTSRMSSFNDSPQSSQSSSTNGPTNPTRATAATTSSSAIPTQPNPSILTKARHHHPPWLPVPVEQVVLLTYPVILLFGSLFSLLSPSTRSTPYDSFAQSHPQDAGLPSYFARKDNIFNVLFVKRGWAWITISFFVFVFTHPALANNRAKIQAATRWALVTTWWFLVTQWFFGPALIDRSYRFTGGACAVVESRVDAEGGLRQADTKDVVSAVACKAAGGSWRGGHDISGHVFLLVLGTFFLLQEVGWVYAKVATANNTKDQRTVVMSDGAVKSATVERQDVYGVKSSSTDSALGIGGRFVFGVIGLSGWMLLMTAIYFHTWFEKLTGLLVALTAIYSVYFSPRLVPTIRGFIGVPGI